MEINRLKGNVVIYVEPIQLRKFAACVPCAGLDGERDDGPGEANHSTAARESAYRNEGSF